MLHVLSCYYYYSRLNRLRGALLWGALIDPQWQLQLLASRSGGGCSLHQTTAVASMPAPMEADVLAQQAEEAKRQAEKLMGQACLTFLIQAKHERMVAKVSEQATLAAKGEQ